MTAERRRDTDPGGVGCSCREGGNRDILEELESLRWFWRLADCAKHTGAARSSPQECSETCLSITTLLKIQWVRV